MDRDKDISFVFLSLVCGLPYKTMQFYCTVNRWETQFRLP